MDVGLLWFDGDPRLGLEDKIGRAARRFREKFGRWPNTCMVNPQAVGSQEDQRLQVDCQALDANAVIRVVPAANILRNHFWVGVSNGNGQSQRSEGNR